MSTNEDAIDRGDLTACEDCVAVQREWWENAIDSARSALGEVNL